MYWEFWMGGLALTSVAIGHWFLVGRMMAVSGRFTALVNTLRFGPTPEPEMTQQQMLEAMRAMTAAEFGEDAVDAASEPAAATPPARPAQGSTTHTLFLACLAIGGLLASLTAGGFDPAMTLRSELFPRVFGGGTGITAATLMLGGALVGFGTRMAAGCTSGHGLCGVSRLQVGSLAATAAFFGAGIVVSLLLGGLL